MGLNERITQDIAGAMKSRDQTRLSALRMAKAALMNAEVAKGRDSTTRRRQQVLASLMKQRRDSIEQFTSAGRTDLVDKERAEIAVLEAYAPPAVSDRISSGRRRRHRRDRRHEREGHRPRDESRDDAPRRPDASTARPSTISCDESWARSPQQTFSDGRRLISIERQRTSLSSILHGALRRKAEAFFCLDLPAVSAAFGSGDAKTHTRCEFGQRAAQSLRGTIPGLDRRTMPRSPRVSSIAYSFSPGPMTPAVRLLLWANVVVWIATLVFPRLVEWLGLVPEYVLHQCLALAAGHLHVRARSKPDAHPLQHARALDVRRRTRTHVGHAVLPPALTRSPASAQG